MYLHKVTSKKLEKKLFFVGVPKVTDEKSRNQISQKYGSADPDPYQSVKDPEH